MAIFVNAINFLSRNKQTFGSKTSPKTKMFNNIGFVLAAEDVEQEERNRLISIRRNLRDFSNPLELQESIFHQFYRVNKPMFRFLLQTLTDSLPASKKMFAVPPIVKLSACLRFFAEGSYQKGVGKDYEVGLAQSTFSEVLSEVLQIFETKLCPTWICFQKSYEEKRKTKLNFYEKHRIPGVIGCIDGTQIRIIAPPQNKHLHYNRKGYFSLNVLLVCDDQMQIIYVDASHPGACHDSLVWNVCDLRAWMEQEYSNGDKNTWLLGDAGYPLEPWLLTPHRTPEARTSESKFNEAHSKTRNIIERTIGVLKNRWRCLLGARELHYRPRKAIIINVCCALLNMCIYFKADTNIAIESTPVLLAEDENNFYNTDSLSSSENMEAQRIRREIGNSL